MSASLAFSTDAMRLLEDEQFLQLNKKEKDPLNPKQPMSAFFMFRNERRAESKCGWEIIEEWNNMTEKQKKPYEKIAKQNMEKYLKEMEAYKQRKEEGSANPKKEEDEMMKIHKQEALELLKKKEKTKENRQKKKKIADPNKPKKPDPHSFHSNCHFKICYKHLYIYLTRLKKILMDFLFLFFTSNLQVCAVLNHHFGTLPAAM
ncbi:High mobility group B protein 13 [Camellia lanceoleosa]|uniref:High mobility group B protein 13 n=1 Tax=Camellia lanceoleosa TaxID=1840588 RepID=A0ACC0FTJ1_9ERIC|nr:High mobility group B protein 13 [Camellia lanceoleosa]